MKIRLADEKGEEIPEVETLVEAIKDFEFKTSLLLADYMMSIKNSFSSTKMFNQTDPQVTCLGAQS